MSEDFPLTLPDPLTPELVPWARIIYSSRSGNTKAVAKLVAGKPVDEIVSLLAGNQCGPRGTSCADQMTIALRQAQQAARELHAS